MVWLATILAARATPGAVGTPTWLVLVYYVSACIIALATIIFGFTRWIWPMLRDVRNFLSGWNGEEPRPEEGYEGRPGVMKRLQTIEFKLDSVVKELHPNSGTSMKDQLTSVTEDVRQIKRKLNE
jgi:hypothetical protein